MKKKISLLLAILMLVTLIPTAFAESKTVDAVKNTKKVTLDGEEVKVGAYDVEGYNYLKLRDIAAILNGKKCQFDVGYDNATKVFSVELAKGYEKLEGDLAEIKDEKAKTIVSVKKILVNGEEKEVKTALINEYNYMQLRDLGSLVGLGVGYDEVNKVIMLKSDVEAKEEKPEEKPEEKKDEKKDDKKDEKKEEVKTEAKVEIVPEDKWTKEEHEWFKDNKEYHDTIVMLVTNVLSEDSDEAVKELQSYFNSMVYLSMYGGNVIIDGGVKSIDKKVEIRDGVRYCVAQYNYPSGSALKFEVSKLGTDDVNLYTYLVNAFILKQENELPEKFQKDSKLICNALIEFYDAIADKDYEKASKVASELGLKADVERVKAFEKSKRDFAEAKGVEIFGKDYETKEELASYNDPDHDPCVAFKYKDGSLFILYFTDVNEGGIVGRSQAADAK